MISYLNSITLKVPLYLANKGKDQQDKISILASGIFVNENILSPDNENQLYKLFRNHFYIPETMEIKNFHITGNNRIIDINKPCTGKAPYWFTIKVNLYDAAVYQLNKKEVLYNLSEGYKLILNEQIFSILFDTITHIKTFVKEVYTLFEIHNYQEIIKGTKIEISTDFQGNFHTAKIKLLNDISRYEDCTSRDIHNHKNKIDTNIGLIIKSKKNIQIIEPITNVFIEDIIKNTACRTEDNKLFKNILKYTKEQLNERFYSLLKRNYFETHRLNQLCQRHFSREETKYLKLGIKECKILSEAIKIKTNEVSYRSLIKLKENKLVIPYNQNIGRQQFYIITI